MPVVAGCLVYQLMKRVSLSKLSMIFQWINFVPLAENIAVQLHLFVFRYFYVFFEFAFYNLFKFLNQAKIFWTYVSANSENKNYTNADEGSFRDYYLSKNIINEISARLFVGSIISDAEHSYNVFENNSSFISVILFFDQEVNHDFQDLSLFCFSTRWKAYSKVRRYEESPDGTEVWMKLFSVFCDAFHQIQQFCTHFPRGLIIIS